MLSVFRSIPYSTAAVRSRCFPAIPDHAEPCGTKHGNRRAAILPLHTIPYPSGCTTSRPPGPSLPVTRRGAQQKVGLLSRAIQVRSAASYPITAFMQAFYILPCLLVPRPTPHPPPPCSLLSRKCCALPFLSWNYVRTYMCAVSCHVTSQGKLAICDFGLARKYEDPIRPYTTPVVTQWYRCPELLLGEFLLAALAALSRMSEGGVCVLFCFFWLVGRLDFPFLASISV